MIKKLLVCLLLWTAEKLLQFVEYLVAGDKGFIIFCPNKEELRASIKTAEDLKKFMEQVGLGHVGVFIESDTPIIPTSSDRIH